MTHEEMKQELELTLSTLERSDFKSSSTFKYWKSGIKKILKGSIEDIKEWANDSKDYLDDFAIDYIRDEIESLIDRIIE